MNRQQAKYLLTNLDIVKAFAKGEDIQIFQKKRDQIRSSNGGGDWITEERDAKWHSVVGISPEIEQNIYRIKPKAILVPFTIRDYQIFSHQWVCKRGGESAKAFKIVDFYANYLLLGDNKCQITYDILVKEFEFLNGKPCGKLLVND